MWLFHRSYENALTINRADEHRFAKGGIFQIVQCDRDRHNNDVVRETSLPSAIADIFFRRMVQLIHNNEYIKIRVLGSISTRSRSEDPHFTHLDLSSHKLLEFLNDFK